MKKKDKLLARFIKKVREKIEINLYKKRVRDIQQPPGVPDGSVDKESTCSAEDRGDRSSVPETAKSPGTGNGHPLHYSCLESSMDRGA